MMREVFCVLKTIEFLDFGEIFRGAERANTSRYMQPLGCNVDLVEVITTSLVSQVPIDSLVGKNNLIPCLAQGHLHFSVTKYIPYTP